MNEPGEHMLSEICLAQNNKYCIVSLMLEILKC